MNEHLCNNCENRYWVIYNESIPSDGGCTKNVKYRSTVKSCSHFEEKQDTKEKPKAEAKTVANKGKPPRKQPKKKEDKKRIPFVGEGNLG